MKHPDIRSADGLISGICPASSVENGKRRFGLVQVSLPLTRVTAADARRLAKVLKRSARCAEKQVVVDGRNPDQESDDG